MANDQKFSDFTSQTNLTNFDGLVGYDNANNYRISPADLYDTLETNLDLTSFTTGTLQPGQGGTGISNFSAANFANDQVDYGNDGSGELPVEHGGTGVNTFSAGFLKADGTNAFTTVSFIDLSGTDVGNVLSIDKGGTGSSTTWKAVQQYAWLGTSTAYANIPNATNVYLPFNSTALIDQSTNTAGATKWTISTTPSGLGPNAPANQSAFTLGGNGGGIWKIEVFYPSFNMIDFVEGKISLDIDNTEIPIVQRNFGNPSQTSGVIQSLYGNLTYNFSGNEVVKVLIRFDGAGGSGPFPGNTSPWTNRPPEITFTRVI